MVADGHKVPDNLARNFKAARFGGGRFFLSARRNNERRLRRTNVAFRGCDRTCSSLLAGERHGHPISDRIEGLCSSCQRPGRSITMLHSTIERVPGLNASVRTLHELVSETRRKPRKKVSPSGNRLQNNDLEQNSLV